MRSIRWKSLAKALALLVAVTCAVWIAVLRHWRITRREVDAGDIVVHLALLPLVVFGLALAARQALRSAWAGEAARTRAKKAAAAAAAGSPDAGSGAASASGTASAPWHLLGAWIRTAGAASADDLSGAVEAGSPRPGPDAELQDDEGLPVLAARIDGLDVDALRSGWQDVAAGAPPPPERATRALAALSPLIEEFGAALRHRAAQWEIDAQARSPSAMHDRVVRVLAAWPSDWDPATCDAARAWLEGRLRDPLADLLPAARWSIHARCMSGLELLGAAQRTLDALGQEAGDDPVVLIACHSDLDAAGIHALDLGQGLFHARRRPRAAMPGEGAAVLAMSAVPWPADAALAGPSVLLERPAMARRSRSIEAPGRSSSAETVRVVERALENAGIAGSAVTRLASDADQHTARATELFDVVLALAPGLDANEDLRLVGTITGRLEAAAPLVALAMAAVQAAASGGPALALSLSDLHARMAAVLRPAPSDGAQEPRPAA